MSPDDVLKHTEKLVGEADGIQDTLSKLIDFYFESEVEGCPKSGDGDMLLFQYGGPYTWKENSVVNLTRQFSFDDDDGEYKGMSQLQVEFNFDNSQYPIGEGSMWLERAGAEEFKAKVLGSDAVKLVTSAVVLETTVELGDV